VRLGLILLTITGYGLICWLDSSVFRAVLMGGMNMVALFRGREINIWRLLSISCIIMLIINPYFLAYDTGFLLSYSAIIGIIAVTSDKWQATSKEKNWEKSDKADQNRIQKALQYIYKSYIQPSIWASIGIFPIIIFFMGKINILGIVWNLFVLPLVPFVMIYGFVSVWLHSWIGWERLLWIEKISVQYIYKISDLLSQYGIYFMVSWLRFKYVVLLVFVVFFVIWRSKSPQPSFVKGDQ
jgi:competence protein ComEC